MELYETIATFHHKNHKTYLFEIVFALKNVGSLVLQWYFLPVLVMKNLKVFLYVAPLIYYYYYKFNNRFCLMMDFLTNSLSPWNSP